MFDTDAHEKISLNVQLLVLLRALVVEVEDEGEV
jgi:hypothetical protein